MQKKQRKQINVSEEDFNNWRKLAETKRFFQFLEEEEYVNRMDIATGGAKLKSVVDSGAEYLQRLAIANIYADLANLEYNDLSIEENEEDADNSKRTTDSY